MSYYDKCFLIGLACIPVIIVLLILIINWGSESPLNTPKLKFSSFKKFYALNPDRWDLNDDYVACKCYKDSSWTRTTKDYFHFGIIDFYRYKLWNKRRDKEHEKKSQAQSVARMIAAVKQDIATAENTAQKQYETATDMIWKVCNNTELMED